MSRRGRPGAGRRAPAGPKPAGAAKGPAAAGAFGLGPAAAKSLRVACLLSPLAALAALAWSLRGAPLGTPVADDFEFISRVVFHRPLDFFDSMGATYYWRPLSRQVWFSLVTPLLMAAPAAIAALHLALFGATAFVLASLARRAVPWPAAALVAAAALSSEPVRALVTWPSGIQHLLAALGLALAAHEALAGRRWTAALAAGAAALSHELGALAFVLVGAGGWLRGARGRAAWADTALGAALAAGYALGYRTALAHGVQLPAGGLTRAAGAWFGALRHALVAAANAETLPELFGQPLVAACGVLFAVSVVALFRSARGTALREAGPLLGAALATAALGLLPLGALLPDWNAWRAFVPVLALVFAMALAGARAHVAIGLAIVLLRVAALAGAQPAGRASGDPPASVSDLSFARLTRIQRVLAASEPLVRGTKIAPGGRVAYWGLPKMTMNGFRNSLAAQVWARDTSVRFVSFEGREAFEDPADVALSYDTREGRGPALTITEEAKQFVRLAMQASDQNRFAEEREYYLRSIDAQKPESPSLTAQVMHNLAVMEVLAGHMAVADSFNAIATRVRGATPDGYAVDALVALGRGDLDRSRRYLNSCLALDPDSKIGLYVRTELERALARRRERAETGR